MCNSRIPKQGRISRVYFKGTSAYSTIHVSDAEGFGGVESRGLGLPVVARCDGLIVKLFK